MFSQNLWSRMKYALGQGAAADELEGLVAAGYVSPFGNAWYVDTFNGNDTVHSGQQADKAFATLSKALSVVATGDTIFCKGDMREEGLIASNLVFDVTVIGTGSQHHPDQPSSAYDPGASMLRPPASPTAATDLLTVRGRGWRFINMAFDCPVDAAAVKLVSNASSGTSEYDGSHASFLNCSFQQGLTGIEDEGGVINVTIDDCVFRLFTPTGGKAIVNTSTSVRTPQYWRIRNCFFPANAASGGNEAHIDAPFNGCLIQGCTFGTVEGSGLYIDLTGGTGNMVVGNYFMGSFSTDDYVAGTGDMWVGNYSLDTAEAEVEASGETNTTPAA